MHCPQPYQSETRTFVKSPDGALTRLDQYRTLSDSGEGWIVRVMSSRSAVKIYPSCLEAPGAIQPQRLRQPAAKEIDNFLGSIRAAENTKLAYRRALDLFAVQAGPIIKLAKQPRS